MDFVRIAQNKTFFGQALYKLALLAISVHYWDSGISTDIGLAESVRFANWD